MTALNLNSLRYFEAAARHLNLRRAAEEFSVTQGAISQQIKSLETNLQVQLFLRTPKGLALTEAGQRLHRPVSEALTQITSALAKLQSLSDRITLSLPPAFAAKWLGSRIARFVEAHPEVELQIRVSEQIPDFGRDGPDLALHLGPPPTQGGLTVARLAPVRMVAVTGPSLIARAPVLPRAAFFARYPLIEDAGRPWQAWFAREAPDTDFTALHIPQTALAIDAADAGQGIALIPDVLVRGALDRKTLVRLREDPPDEARGVYLLHAARAPDTRARQIVIDWIRSEFGA